MKRTLHTGFVLGIALLFLGAIVEWRALSRADDVNAAIGELLAGRDVPLQALADAPPEVRLARAIYLHRKHRDEDALATIALIMDQGDVRFRAKVRYNLGNFHLARAVEQVELSRFQQAIPLLEMAKSAYREALLLDSGYWDAKYNLEVAMRLVPEMDRVTMTEEGEDEQADALWTSVPGFPRGLP